MVPACRLSRYTGVMAGMIKREDIERVREETRIEDIVGERVTLKTAGVGSLKGLCPFHEERTPSFHVRPQLGVWHCFGCNEGGDAINFVQKIDHLNFVETVEFLADKAGITLNYEEGTGRSRGVEPGQRQRLLEAHRIAETFYREQLNSPAAEGARRFLAERGFDQNMAAQFGVGYSPDSWDALTRHLRGKSFTDAELITAGLLIQGNRGPYDRFRDRVMWPIRDLTGATIGFGARRLGDDPNQPKYLNSPESPIYRKSQVLYGLDLAKRDISRQRRIVVVEGYTDVMAAQIAGETTAVATCGTAFGADHVQVVRRLLGDGADPAAGVALSGGRSYGGEIIFTFDGDEAGRNAARKVYVEDQKFAAQTFVAIEPHGWDPCDLRLKRGDAAVIQLVNSRIPLFEFVLRSVVSELDLNTAEGRVQAVRIGAPVLEGIRDVALRAEYVRQFAGWVGVEVSAVRSAVRDANRNTVSAAPPATSSPKDPVERLERQALEALLQRPLDMVGLGFERIDPEIYSSPVHRAVHEAVFAAGGVDRYLDLLDEAESAMGVGEDSTMMATRRWNEEIRNYADPVVAEMVTQLIVEQLLHDDPKTARDYVRGLMRALIRQDVTRKISAMRRQLQRLSVGSEEHQQLLAELMVLDEQHREYVENAT